jgi:hypothetical protein
MDVCCECCVLSGKCLCDGLGVRLCCVVLYDLTPRELGGSGPLGAVAPQKKMHSPMGNTVRNSLRMEDGIGN